MCDDLVAGVYAAVITSTIDCGLWKISFLGGRMMERKESIGKDATSKETLEDLEENEESTDEVTTSGNLPSPDGAFDEPKEQNDAIQCDRLIPCVFVFARIPQSSRDA